MNLNPYLDLGEDRPKWAPMADSLISRKCLKNPETDKEARVNTFLQKWNTKTDKLPSLLKDMVYTAEKFGFFFDDIHPNVEIRAAMPLWHHIGEDPNKRQPNGGAVARCLRSRHSVILVGEAADMIKRFDDKTHTYQPLCPCSYCHEDRVQRLCPHPHKCAALAKRKLDCLKVKWDPRIPDTEDTSRPTELQLSQNDESESYPLHLPKSINSIPDGFRVLTLFTALDATQDPPISAPRVIDTDQPMTVWVSGISLHENYENTCTGGGIVFDGFSHKDRAIRVPRDLPQTRSSGVLTSILCAIQSTPPAVNLDIHVESKSLAKGLSNNLEKWEDMAFVGKDNRLTLQAIAARLRAQTGKTMLIVTKDDDEPTKWQEARDLAREGAAKRHEDRINWSAPKEFSRQGVKLSCLTQSIAGKAIRALKVVPKDLQRKKTLANLKMIKQAVTTECSLMPTTKDIWRSVRREPFTRRFRNFLYLMIHGAQRTGEYWKHIPTCEDRQMCSHCEVEESMEHILTQCTNSVQATVWELAKSLLDKRGGVWPTISFGTLMGCGLVNIVEGGSKVDTGRTRLFRIIISESMHVIWKIRCDVTVDGEDIPSRDHIINKWTRAINCRLEEDRLLTNKFRYKKKALEKSTVLETWKRTLQNEDSLPKDWTRGPEVLVGIGKILVGNLPTDEDCDDSLSEGDSLLLDHG
ncbi:hypothetical protein C8J56DRAFT_897067 [Mycena floridula]|nr:hypothetical protein C8J56DRAFT_897067 [Mycena floridula]